MGLFGMESGHKKTREKKDKRENGNGYKKGVCRGRYRDGEERIVMGYLRQGTERWRMVYVSGDIK